MPSNHYSSARADDTEERAEEQRRLEIRLIAEGGLPFPRGLQPTAQRRLIHEVSALRRQRLVDFLALLVARHLAARRAADRESLQHVKSPV